jgi:ABC-type Fe3+ transport system permease subunit
MKRDVLCYGVVLAGSIFFMFSSLNITMTQASMVSSAFFPRILLGVMIVLSILGLYKAVKEKDADSADADEKKTMRSPFAVIIALCIGFFVLLNLAGFVIATAVFLFAASLYMTADLRPKNVAILAGTSFAIAFAVNYIFTEILLFILP